MVLAVLNLRKAVAYTFGSILFVIVFLHFRLHIDDHPHGVLKPEKFSDVAPSIAKVSVVYGDQHANFNHAIETHKHHAALHHYSLHILRNALVDGYWNKVLFLLQITIQELGKNAKHRVEWLM